MLHVFGDSYSTPDYCVEKAHSWWGRLAQDMDTPVTNWVAGDYLIFDHTMLHGSVNAGRQPKYTCQITGILK